MDGGKRLDSPTIMSNAHPVDPSTLTADKEKAILCAMYAIWKQETRDGKTDLKFEEWLKSAQK